MFIDSSDKPSNAYFVPNILIGPRGYSSRQVIHTFKVHPSLQPAGRPGSAVYKEGKTKGWQGMVGLCSTQNLAGFREEVWIHSGLEAEQEMGWESVLVRGNRMYRGSDIKKNVTHLKDWPAEWGGIGGPHSGTWVCGRRSLSGLISYMHETEG